MNTTHLRSSTTVNGEVVSKTTYISSTLSSLFASLLTGNGSVGVLAAQKYFDLYNGRAYDKIVEYETTGEMTDWIAESPVRVSTTSGSSSDNGSPVVYYAKFIATFTDLEKSFPAIDEGTELCLSLRAGGGIVLATTSFDSEMYKKIVNGNRVEVEWKLSFS